MTDDADELLDWNTLKERVGAMPKGTSYKLAKAIGMNTSYFYRKLNSRKGELTVKQLKAVRRFMEQGDTAPVTVEDQSRAFVQRHGEPSLPVYGYPAGGSDDAIAFGGAQILEYLALPHGLALGPGEYFAMRVIGSTMEPRLFVGEHAIVRRGYPPARDRDVVLEFNDGTALIKTFQGQRNGRVYVKQWNDDKVLDFDATTVKLHAVAFKL